MNKITVLVMYYTLNIQGEILVYNNVLASHSTVSCDTASVDFTVIGIMYWIKC